MPLADAGGTSSRRPRRHAPPALAAVVVLLAIGALVPVAFVLQAGLAVGPAGLAEMLVRPRVGRLLFNTAVLLGFGVPLTIVLGIGCAWLVERTSLPGRRFFTVAFAAPLAIPAFIASYGWASAVPGLGGAFGGVLIAVLAYFPLVYLPVLAALRGMDRAQEETARALGCGSWRVFFRVVLPQLRLAALGGGLVVALHLLAEYGAFAFVGFDTFTTAIMTAYETSFAGPQAASLGLVLALLAGVLLGLEHLVRGRGRYARVGRGAARPAARIALGGWTALALTGALLLVAVSVAVPLATVVRWLLRTPAEAYAPVLGSLATTAPLAATAAVAAIAVACPVVFLAVRFPRRSSRALEAAMFLSGSLPSIVIALALVTVAIRFVPALYQTHATLIAGYVLFFIPRALVPLRARLAQIPEALEEAARSLGVPPVIAFARVTLPLLLPGLAAGAALVALGAANELTATLLLAPTGTRTVATGFWSAVSAVDYAGAAPYAAVLVLLSIPAVALTFAQTFRRPV